MICFSPTEWPNSLDYCSRKGKCGNCSWAAEKECPSQCSRWGEVTIVTIMVVIKKKFQNPLLITDYLNIILMFSHLELAVHVVKTLVLKLLICYFDILRMAGQRLLQLVRRDIMKL